MRFAVHFWAISYRYISNVGASVSCRQLRISQLATPCRSMAQRSITNFFSKAAKPGADSAATDDAPMKKVKRTKRQRIDSSDSEPPSPKKCTETPKRVDASPKLAAVKCEASPDLAAVKCETSPKLAAVKCEASPLAEKDTNVEWTSPFSDRHTTLNDDKPLGKVTSLEYEPGKTKYHPIEDACWSRDEPVPYLALARTLERIETTSARTRIVQILSNYLRSVIVLTPVDLLPSVYLCLNRLAPAYHNLELGVAETYLMKAIAQSTGRTLAQVKTEAGRVGDLGLVAEQSRSTQRVMFQPPPLTLRRVFTALKDIAALTGQASMNKKVGKIQSLFVACRESEARFLIRSLAGKLRVGLAEQSVLQALAQAAATTPPAQPYPPPIIDASRGLDPDTFKARVEEQALIVKTTYCECPNYETLLPVLLQEGVSALPVRCRLTPGVPLKPMLAHPTRGVAEVFHRVLPEYLQSAFDSIQRGAIRLIGDSNLTDCLQSLKHRHIVDSLCLFYRFENVEFTCEWKYDGERAQIHVPSDADGRPHLAKAAIFSRNQEDNTSKYPDLLNRLGSLLKEDVQSCVLDCEAVAWDKKEGRILPFQVLSTRKRKDAAVDEIKVQVCVFMFDLLYLNGRPLVREPYVERRRLLRQHFNSVPGEWCMAASRDCSTLEEVQEYLEESVKGSCEGLMVKTLNGDHATYEIAKRSRNWLKLKKDYLEGVGDTVDACVIGAYHGRGKRAGTYGGFLLACYDPQTEQYQTLCKLGTGFSDEDLQQHTLTLQQHRIDEPRSYYRYDESQSPDVWLSACAVWEVRCADLSLSPVHRAAIGLVDPDKGISLRFPRFVRVRTDKTAENSTTAQQVAELYLGQDQVKNQPTVARRDDDFY